MSLVKGEANGGEKVMVLKKRVDKKRIKYYSNAKQNIRDQVLEAG